MNISYQHEYLRECCRLSRPASLNTSFTTLEIKFIRACIADLRAAPKLNDCPLSYFRNRHQNTVEIRDGSIKIICKIISSFDNPMDDQIERLKITKILNTDLQLDVQSKHNSK